MNKTIYYFRALGHNDHPVDIQKPLTALLRKLSNAGSTEYRFADEVIRVQRRKIESGFLKLHFISYRPGEKSPTIKPKASTIDDEEIGQAPQAGREFKESECFLVIKEHHAIFCGNGISQSKARLYIHMITQKNGVSLPFQFAASSDVNKLALINAQGVKSIKLNVHAYKLSVPPKKRTWVNKAFGNVTEEVVALMAKDKSRDQERALEDLIVSVELGLDGNTRAAESAQITVKELAQKVISDNESEIDSFVIHTHDGTPISSKQIRLHDTIKVGRRDGSLNHADAWNGMSAFYDSLKVGKLLEK